MATFSLISKQRLASCDNRLQLIANEAIIVQDHTILQGHRGQEDQHKAFLDGSSKLDWPHGNHNSMPSRALDMGPVYYEVGMKIDWGDVVAFGRIAGIYQAIAFKHGIRLRFGLDWDGDFRTVGRDPDEKFLDAPHIELLDP